MDRTQRLTLKGNVHRLAQPQFEAGVVASDLPMDRMLLVLKRSPEQRAELDKLLDEQQDKNSPHYRQWLTPDQFGQRFGLADADIQEITSWLQNEGFHDVKVSRGRTVIEFSGTAAQVQSALHASIKKFVVNGAEHIANANEPSIPAALANAVAGVFTMHNFYKKPLSQTAEGQFTAKAIPGRAPEFTASNGLHALTPVDFWTIYGFNPPPFTSATVGIVGRSNINLGDVFGFHSLTGDGATWPQVIVNGPDPGNLGGGEEAEAVLDTTWAGAVAPSAGVILVVSQSTATTDGVDLSELYIIDNNLADVMSESFSGCEASVTSAEAAGIASLAQQAAAQGITYVVPTGDSGSAGCDDPNTVATATHGLSVNVLASPPSVVAVGGTVFNENGQNTKYWRTTNTPQLESAISYIPENVWNESCKTGQTGCTKQNIWAGGGGASIYFSKPPWQTGVTGVPTDTMRHIPDVSLSAASHDPYLVCIRSSCVPDSQGFIRFAGVSGTSASAPAFAGIMALVAQKTGVRLGQPNYVLYRLAAAENLTQCNGSSTTTPPASTCVFNDVTVGNNAVPGVPNYGTPSASYQSGKGYDQATGLGSVNVTNLINQWNTVTFSPTTTTFSISPTNATHGAAFTVTGSVTGGGATKPSGVVWLERSGSGGLVGSHTVEIFNLDSQGSFNTVTHLLPGGYYQMAAHYAGDGTYGGSDSAPPVSLTIQPEASTLALSVLTKDAGGNFVPLASGPYGTPVYFKIHISGQSGYGTPTGSADFMDQGRYVVSGARLDGNGDVVAVPALPSAGAHSTTATYYGDNNFSRSSSPAPVNFTITQVATTSVLTTLQLAQSLLVSATVSAPINAPAPTGLVTLSSGNTVLGTNPLNPGTPSNGATQSGAAFDITQFAAGSYNLTAAYAGDVNYTASTSAPMSLNLVADFTVTDRGITSRTVAAGQTAQYINDLAVTPFFGYASDVSVTCAVPARDTKCTVTPASYTLANGQGVGSIAITTKVRSSAALQPPSGLPVRPQVWLASMFALFGCVLTVPSGGKRRRIYLGTMILALVLVLSMLGMNACGGGGSGGGPPPPPASGTLVGTYKVTVTGTSGNLTHTMNLTLVVQ